MSLQVPWQRSPMRMVFYFVVGLVIVSLIGTAFWLIGTANSQLITVVVVTREVRVGQQITDADVVEMQSGALPESLTVMTSTAGVVGRYATRLLPQGTIVAAADIQETPPAVLVTRHGNLVPDDMVLVTVRDDSLAPLLTSVTSDDRVATATGVVGSLHVVIGTTDPGLCDRAQHAASPPSSWEYRTIQPPPPPRPVPDGSPIVTDDPTALPTVPDPYACRVFGQIPIVDVGDDGAVVVAMHPRRALVFRTLEMYAKQGLVTMMFELANSSQPLLPVLDRQYLSQAAIPDLFPEQPLDTEPLWREPTPHTDDAEATP